MKKKRIQKKRPMKAKLSCIRQKTIRQQIIYRQDQNNSAFLLNTFSHQETRQTKYSCNIRVSISHLIPILYITNIYRRVSTQNIGRYQPILSSLSTPQRPFTVYKTHPRVNQKSQKRTQTNKRIKPKQNPQNTKKGIAYIRAITTN